MYFFRYNYMYCLKKKLKHMEKKIFTGTKIVKEEYI